MKIKTISLFVLMFLFGSSITFAGYQVFTDVQNGAWYENAISIMKSYKIMNGYEDGTFKPNNYVTRAELAQTISKLIEENKLFTTDDEQRSISASAIGINATVNIKSEKSMGAGVLISNNKILTAYHVVDDLGENITIVSSRNRSHTFKTNVLKKDEKLDLALIEFVNKDDQNYDNITPIKFATNSPLIGESILITGNPDGYNSTVTKGIVSHNFRKSGELRKIQFDAPISKGNSGGAAINLNGKLVGIVVTKRIAEGVEGIGFAVSIEDIQKFLDSK